MPSVSSAQTSIDKSVFSSVSPPLSPLLIGAQLRVLINIVYESPAAFDAIILATDPMAYAQP